MNQGRIWCVVNPSIGLPLLLGSVALTSLAVHTSVMTNTTWMSNYWQGSARTRVSEAPATPALATAGVSFTVAPGATVDGAPSYVITVVPTAAAPAVVGQAASGPMRSASVN